MFDYHFSIKMKTSFNLKNYRIAVYKNKDKVKSNHANNVNIRTINNYSNKNIIITILSNKGGVGKTSISIALALYLSQIIGKKTLLLELDSSPGDFSVLFDIGRNKSLELALRFPEKYNEFTKNICTNMDVLKGISDPLIAESVAKGIINNLLDIISRDYEYIIIDTQTVINGLILDVLKISDEVFVISDYSIESIARISNLIEVLIEKFKIERSKIKLIINKKKMVHFFKINDVSMVIKLPIYAFIKFDSKFNKRKFIFNKNNILNTKFFKETSCILSTSINRPEGNAKRQTL